MESDQTQARAVALSESDRARLRPGVDTVALEHFLSAVPAPTRRVVLLSFMRDATVDELRAAAGMPEPGPIGEGAAAALPATREDFIITVDSHADPELQRLWRAIEPAVPEHREPAPPPPPDGG